jgi:hypothetical protein
MHVVAPPAFLVDVESVLKNLQFSQAQARKAIQQTSGDNFEAILKQSLEFLRKPVAKVTA